MKNKIIGQILTGMIVSSIMITPLQNTVNAAPVKYSAAENEASDLFPIPEVRSVSSSRQPSGVQVNLYTPGSLFTEINNNVTVTAKKDKTSNKYDKIKECFDNLTAVKQRGKWGFINDEGKLVTPVKYDAIKVNKSIDAFTDHYVAVKLKGKWGFVDDEGKVKIKPKYEKVGNIVHGIAKVRNKGKWGFVNTYDGKNTTPFKYDKIENYYADDAVIFIEGKKGLAVEGYEVIEPKYDEIDYEAGDSYIKVKLGNKWGFADTYERKEIISPKYDEVKDFRHQRATVKTDGKWGVINMSGDEIIPVKYDYIGEFDADMAKVKLDNKWGIIGAEGDIIVPADYDKLDTDIEHNEKNKTATLSVTVALNGKTDVLKYNTKIEAYTSGGYSYGKWTPAK